MIDILCTFSYFISLPLYRAVNNEILDSFVLGSLDSILEQDLRYYDIVKQPEGKLVLKSRLANIESDGSILGTSYDRIISCLGFRWDSTIFHT